MVAKNTHYMLCHFKILAINYEICIPALTQIFFQVFSYLQSVKCFEAQLQIML